MTTVEFANAPTKHNGYWPWCVWQLRNVARHVENFGASHHSTAVHHRCCTRCSSRRSDCQIIEHGSCRFRAREAMEMTTPLQSNDDCICNLKVSKSCQLNNLAFSFIADNAQLLNSSPVFLKAYLLNVENLRFITVCTLSNSSSKSTNAYYYYCFFQHALHTATELN